MSESSEYAAMRSGALLIDRGDRVRIRGRAWIGFEREAGVGFLFFHATPV